MKIKQPKAAVKAEKLTTSKSSIKKRPKNGGVSDVKKIGKFVTKAGIIDPDVSKLVKASKVSSKKNKKLLSPEVQLGLKIDALLAERSSREGSVASPSGSTPVKKNSGSDSKEDASPAGLFVKRRKLIMGSKSKETVSDPSDVKIKNLGKTKRIVPTETPVSSSKLIKSKKSGLALDVILDRSEVLKPVQALIDMSKTKKDKNYILDNACKYVFLQIDFKIIVKATKRVIRLPLAHRMVSDVSDVCLFVTNSKKDPEETVQLYKKLLKKEGIKSVTEIIPLKELASDFKQFEDKRKLNSRFSLFLVDSKICHRVFPLLGKSIIGKRKVPVPVRIRSNISLKSEIEGAFLKTTAVYQGYGNSLSVQIGHSDMSTEEIIDNIMSVGKYFNTQIPGGWANVRKLSVKLERSAALPLYLSAGPPPIPIKGEERSCLNKESDRGNSHLTMSPNQMVWSKKKGRPIVDELSTLMDGKVKVYPSGDVQVISENKGKKKKTTKKSQRKRSKGKDVAKKSEKDSEEDDLSDTKEFDVDDIEKVYLQRYLTGMKKANKAATKETTGTNEKDSDEDSDSSLDDGEDDKLFSDIDEGELLSDDDIERGGSADNRDDDDDHEIQTSSDDEMPPKLVKANKPKGSRQGNKTTKGKKQVEKTVAKNVSKKAVAVNKKAGEVKETKTTVKKNVKRLAKGKKK